MEIDPPNDPVDGVPDREAARELISSAEYLFSRISDGAQVFLATGVVVLVQEHLEYNDEMLGRMGIDKQYRAQYIMAHEGVHVAQLLTCPAVWQEVQNLMELTNWVNGLTKKGVPEHLIMPEAKKNLERIRNERYDRAHNFSMNDLIEAQAVLEASGPMGRNKDLFELLKLLKVTHGGESSYTNVIGAGVRQFAQHSFDLIPKLCWLALQTKIPGQAFNQWLSELEDVPISALIGISLTDLCTRLGVPIDGLDKNLRQRDPSIAKGPALGPLYNPYFDAIEQLILPRDLPESACHPVTEIRNGQSLVELAMPPVLLFSDRAVRLFGPHRERGFGVVHPLIQASSVFTRTMLRIYES